MTPSCVPQWALRNPQPIEEREDVLVPSEKDLRCLESHDSRHLSKDFFSKQGSTPTPWARGLRDQIQKWALQTQKALYF